MTPADIVDTAEDAAQEELPPLIVRRPLEAFLDGHGFGEGEIEAERIGEGHSNLTFLLKRGEDRFVLRRPPRPPLPPSAHDVLREARVLRAIQDTPARVPEVLLTSEDGEHGDQVLGVPFYLMPYLEGEVITHELPEPLDTPEERARVARELIDALVEVHALDPFEHGLEGFGKPTGYLERQLRRFTGLWEHNRTREVPEIEQTTEWLQENMPESPPATIVHGDFRLGNSMFAPGAPAELIALFDWELSTIGDPLADVGYLTATYAQADDPQNLFTQALSQVTAREGFPSRDELVAQYEEKTGRSASDLRWYQALALWKSAVFLEGNYKRYIQGASDDDFYRMMERGIPELAQAALDVTRQPPPST